MTTTTMAFSSTPTLPLLLAVGCLGMLVPLVASAPPTCPRGGLEMTWHEDSANCSAFYVCHAGRRYSFTCGALDVWSQQAKTCVGKNSPLDKCTIAKELDDLNSGAEDCANSNSAVFAKADNCAQYYDCESQRRTVTSDGHVLECPFPQLFNSDTKQCQHYDTVKCGARPEPKDACEYEANQCRRAHCIPCNVRFPSCKGLPDGLNPWVGKEYSPYYVICQNERAVYQGQCDNSNGTQIFDPEKNMCAEMKPKM